MDERRRQRRQQRILEAGQSRLSKITGNVQTNKTPEPTIQRRNSTDDPSEELGAPEPLDADPFNQAFFGTPPFLNQPSATLNPLETPVNDSSKYWNLGHLVLMTLLALYTVYRERSIVGQEQFSLLLSQNNFYIPSTPLFWYFTVLELGLQSARFLIQKGQVASTSTLATFATQLPSPFGPALTVFFRYRLIGTCLIQDLSILIFVLGISMVISLIF